MQGNVETDVPLPNQYSVTGLGDFYEFLATNCLTKVALIFCVTFWAISNNVTIAEKVCGYFLSNFWGNWATFYSIIW